jgi:hypothetical protein
MRQQSLRCSFQYETSKFEHIGATGDLESTLRILLNQQHGDATLAIEGADQSEDLRCQPRTEAK